MPTVRANPLFDPTRDVLTDAGHLQALSHPLRIQLLGLLRRDGASTASKLADKLKVSSGLTSYHLRQLEAARFITEAEGVGTGRERWWQAAARSTYVQHPRSEDAEAGAVTTDYLNAVLEVNFGNARAFLAEQDRWPVEWRKVSDFSDMQLELTPAEAEQLAHQIAEVIAGFRRHEAGAPVPEGASVVSAQYQIFPTPGQS